MSLPGGGGGGGGGGDGDYHMAEMAASNCSSEKGECSQSTSSLLAN